MNAWIKGVDYPEWGNEMYIATISKGYLQENETPREAYKRIAKAAASYLKKSSLLNLEEKFFNMFWNGWLIPSSPVMSNFGTDTGLPVSCFGSVTEDSISSIWDKASEIAMMSKMGGGTSLYMSDIRPVGSLIKNGKGGVSDGIMPFTKVYDATVSASKQGKTRKGALAVYLKDDHPERNRFLRLATSESGENFRPHLQHGFCFTDDFMKSLNTNEENKEFMKSVIKMRVEKGIPYCVFIDTANRLKHNWWNKELTIKASNLCTEIFLPSDSKHSFTCVLSSLNLYKYDEWQDTDTVLLSIMFLDAVAEDFIQKASAFPELKAAVNFTKKARALGLGALGLGSYFHKRKIEYGSLQSQLLSRIIFGKIRNQADFASRYLASEFGQPEWCKDSPYRNLTLLAIAPNRSSSLLAGGLSEGIQPIVGNIYSNQTAKGTFKMITPELLTILEERGYDTDEILKSIFIRKGSVQHLDCLTKEEKDIFKTRFEIDQADLVRLTAVIQEYIDQGISCNLSFPQDAPPKYIYDVHILAWELGLKSLYYLKSESNLAIEKQTFTVECKACEG